MTGATASADSFTPVTSTRSDRLMPIKLHGSGPRAQSPLKHGGPSCNLILTAWAEICAWVVCRRSFLYGCGGASYIPPHTKEQITPAAAMRPFHTPVQLSTSKNVSLGTSNKLLSHSFAPKQVKWIHCGLCCLIGPTDISELVLRSVLRTCKHFPLTNWYE